MMIATDVYKRQEVAPLLQQLVVKELLDNYPDMEYCCIGSIGKKKDGEYNGDIDIAIKADTIEELEEMCIRDRVSAELGLMNCTGSIPLWATK